MCNMTFSRHLEGQRRQLKSRSRKKSIIDSRKRSRGKLESAERIWNPHLKNYFSGTQNVSTAEINFFFIDPGIFCTTSFLFCLGLLPSFFSLPARWENNDPWIVKDDLGNFWFIQNRRFCVLRIPGHGLSMGCTNLMKTQVSDKLPIVLKIQPVSLLVIFSL